MSLNPIYFANKVNEQFIRYQLTAFPISDPILSSQAKKMLKNSLDEHSPILKGPYISLSRQFKTGISLKDLADSNTIHKGIERLVKFPNLFAHQSNALKSIQNNKHCLVTTGTGSGKTEAFLIPIIDHCFKLRDEGSPEGVVAILIYPMNALASDQLTRLREMLAGTGISFGMYIGSTPHNAEAVQNIKKMKEGEDWSKSNKYMKLYEDHKNITIAPWEERIDRSDIVARPPRILITNPSQLEYLMTRGKDISLFFNAPLKFLVLDESHTYTGAMGKEY